jgi:acyl carrier protein
MGRPDGEIAETIHAFILREFLPGELPENLTATTPLISTGILDSIARLQLVGFLEDTFGITIAARQVSVDHFETIRAITELVRAKQPAR